jgi:hypothetical protein
MAPMARVTPSISALTKFSVTGSPLKRDSFGCCAKAIGAGASEVTSIAAANAAVSGRRGVRRVELLFMLIRSK